MALLTDEQEGFSAKPRWLNEGWWDGAEEYWQDLMEDGCLGEAVSGGKPVSRINPSGEESDRLYRRAKGTSAWGIQGFCFLSHLALSQPLRLVARWA